MAYLCFDLGTTRLKVAVVDGDGRLLERREARLTDFAEGTRRWQSANEWWARAAGLARRLGTLAPIEAITVSGRGGAAVFVDERGAVLVDPWSDARHAQQLAELRRWRESPAQLSNYAAALIAKLLWLRANEPVRFARVAKVLYGKDLLLLRLTGRAITDPASGPDAMDWPSPVLAAFEVPRELLPDLALPWHVAGPLTTRAARELGIASGTPVVVGGHDGICANVGCGAASVGDWALTLGTHAVVRCIASKPIAGARRFYGLPPNRQVIGGNGYYAGRAADWFLDLIFGAADERRLAHFAELEDEALGVPAGAQGISFQPFLGGRVAPDWRPDADASFAGLRLDHGRADLYRAVLEGGAFAVRAIVEQMAEWCGPPHRIRLTGGGANGRLWPSILANVLATPLEHTGEAAECVGTAIFAAIALGRFPDYDAAAAAMVRCQRRFAPESAAVDRYDALYRQWRSRAWRSGPSTGLDHARR